MSARAIRGLRVAAGLLLAAAIAAVVLNRAQFDAAAIESAVRALGAWGPLAHVALFALGTVLFAPGALFGLAGGALFGPLWGTAANLVGATLGATAAFLIARYLAADRVRARLRGPLDRLVAGVEAEGWRFVAFVRLVPLFPFNALNYALGLTRIRLLPYVLASLVTMIPGTLAYSWLGHAGRAALAGSESAIRYGLLGLALVAVAAFVPRLAARLRAPRAPVWMEVAELAACLGAPGLTVVDVRGPDEYDGPLGHIERASNVPLDTLKAQPLLLDALRAQRLVLVCRTDRRSAAAAQILSDAGHRDLRILRGGMEAWTRAGLAVSRAASPGIAAADGVAHS